MKGKNGYFQLLIKNDGTYLVIHEAEEGGNAVFYDEISTYLVDQKIFEFDKIAIGRALTLINGTSEVKISSEVITPVNESVRVLVSEDKMVAKGRFYPPSNNGANITRDDIVHALVSEKVKYGLDEQVIAEFLSKREYCTDYYLANATPVVQGKDAEISYYFNTDLTLKPKRNDDGTVDFHQLDTISHCNKGDLLASLTPMDNGKPGIDVCGNIIRPFKVNNRSLRHGNNIYLSDDGLQMYSSVSGHVSLTDGRVFVSDIYEVPANVDASTGDIIYEGNVVIRGNVINGFSVRARGDIEVNGVVEGAYLEAGGQIVLKRGMQGMNRGILRANGNIITKFLENAEVYAGGYVSTESILHSKVSAKGDIIVGGKRGFVTGGEIRSATLISVKTAGSQMGTTTLLEVGIDPSIIQEYRELEKKITNMMKDKEKLSQALAIIRKKLDMGATLDHEKKEFLMQITQNNITLETQLKESRKRCEELRIEMDHSNTSGIIKVSDSVYPGTKIVISNVVYFVREEIKYSRFIRDRADIKVLPL